MYQTIKSYFILCCLIFTAAMATSCNQKSETKGSADSPRTSGKQLEERMWKAMANTNMDWVRKHVADNFQSVHSNGSQRRSEELKLIDGLKLDQYTLKNFETTRVNGDIIVTYTAEASEIIDNKRTGKAPAPRLSVWSWQPADSVWQWAAHANLKPL